MIVVIRFFGFNRFAHFWLFQCNKNDMKKKKCSEHKTALKRLGVFRLFTWCSSEKKFFQLLILLIFFIDHAVYVWSWRNHLYLIWDTREMHNKIHINYDDSRNIFIETEHIVLDYYYFDQTLVEYSHVKQFLIDHFTN